MSLLSLSPIDAAARLAGRRGRALLHATRSDDDLGRHTFLAAEPEATLIARGRSLVLLDAAGRPTRRFTGDPLDAAEAFLAEHGCRLERRSREDQDDKREREALERRGDAAPEPRVIGYLGYDLVRVIEPLPGGAALAHNGPDLWLAAYGAVARWSAGELAIVGRDDAARDRLAEALARPAAGMLAPVFGPLVAADDDAHHIARIERVRDHIAAGDVQLIHLARRLVARITSPGDALALHAALAEVAPAPCAALLEIDGTTLIAAAVERFLAALGDRVETRAAAGAEHRTILDIARNDLGRIAETGSIAVDEPDRVASDEPAGTAQITARPRRGSGLAALLRATFPAASVTGAPRLRAMQLIDELEPSRRGPYGGALGYFGAHGAFELAVASRIGVIGQGELRVHAGGAIAADTDADAAAARAETERAAAPWRAALARLARSEP
jgi:para-aminobenzoate synthetase component 1